MHMTTTGVVLREVDYKESDKILTILTRDAGRLTVSARGCRKKNSPIAAVSQLLCYSEFTLYEYNNRWNIREGELKREFRAVRSDLEALSLGAWFAELTETLTVEGEADEGALRLLLNTLHVMETGTHPLGLMKAVFELKMLETSGLAPLVDSCAICGEDPAQPRLHLTQGVIHCPHCRAALGAGISVPLAPGALAAMRHILYGDEKKIFSFRLSDAAAHEFTSVTEAFLLTQLERGFHTLDFYKQMTQPLDRQRNGAAT